MNIGQIYSFISQQVMFVWLLVFITPLYIFMASILAKGIHILYNMATNKQSLINNYLGDITWLFPFKQNEQEFKLIHTLFLAVLIAVASLIVLGGLMLLNFMEQSKQYEENREDKQQKKMKAESK
ncbi:unnamed protein product (macronuclear) [Paramecium tetraurelia]|uniref:Uncharacterized protein n=1 Tax=Paramecium tetraurelia TaxID=5888 RepID=A0CGK8_PARTE|nr:uncharacterized protein GSPATT00007365001 [Paramecium tetraurelia]CAK69925.1 unnamed protein product [Paramecium tetraurelia]|eukprot:XP_001437322.1 hypothetical protein (macronuclear) [Paramecium tetraurelia strain d4-2]